MRNKIVILMYFLVFNPLIYSEPISPEDLFFPLELPDFVVKDHNIKVMGNREERQLKSEMVKEFDKENMFVFRIESYDLSAIIDQFPDRVFTSDFETLLKENPINESEIYDYLEKPGKYKTFSPDYGNQFFDYDKLVIDGITVGEIIFKYSKENSLYPSGFQYEVVFIKNEKLYRLFYGFNDPLKSIPLASPGFFIERQGNWYTKSIDYDFHYEITEGEMKNIPEYNQFFSGWDLIFNSLKTGLILSQYERDNITFGILNNYRVRIRTQPNLDGEQLGYLDKDQRVVILDQTDTSMQIGEMNSVWYKIRTDNGIEGWAYGYFIDLE